MPVLENETKYPKTIGFIYKETAKRLKNRKLMLKLTDAEIAGDFDRKVINRILNNTRTHNNVYLIPPAYVKPLMNNLGLRSDYEVFWGDAEDEQFIESVFCNLLTDILDEWEWDEPYCGESSKADIIEKVLLDDVAYAKICPEIISSYEILSPDGDDYLPISPFAYINGDKQISLAERGRIRQKAIQRLYANTRPIQIFSSFFQETNSCGENKGFSKLDKRLDDFVAKSLMPFMKDNIPGLNSLGLRVYSIISADLANYVETTLTDAVRESEGFDSCVTPERAEVLQALMSAGRDYINIVEQLQMRLDMLNRKERFEN